MIRDVGLEKINHYDFFSLDCKHLKGLLISKTFEGSESERQVLMKKLQELENEFSSISTTLDIKNIKEEWDRKYTPLKFQVYKTYGYTSKY